MAIKTNHAEPISRAALLIRCRSLRWLARNPGLETPCVTSIERDTSEPGMGDKIAISDYYKITPENAARIVACVNACEGFTTEALIALTPLARIISDHPNPIDHAYERGRATAAAEIEGLRRQRDEAQRQRDWLLDAARAALRLLTDGDAEPAQADGVIRVLVAAIARGAP